MNEKIGSYVEVRSNVGDGGVDGGEDETDFVAASAAVADCFASEEVSVSGKTCEQFCSVEDRRTS